MNNFVITPRDWLQFYSIPDGAIKTIDFNAKVRVKNYAPQKIINQNERQIALLSEDDIEMISSVLKDHIPILDFFGYELLELSKFR